jgi:hypothetical protein
VLHAARMKKTTSPKKLALATQLVRTLTDEQLKQVPGGLTYRCYMMTNRCDDES